MDKLESVDVPVTSNRRDIINVEPEFLMTVQEEAVR